LYLFCAIYGKNTCRCREKQHQLISTSGSSLIIPIAIAFLMRHFEKVPSTFFKKERSSHDTPSCSVPVSTWKYSKSHFLIGFSTRLSCIHGFFLFSAHIHITSFFDEIKLFSRAIKYKISAIAFVNVWLFPLRQKK
jgi:hypothetical protein